MSRTPYHRARVKDAPHPIDTLPLPTPSCPQALGRTHSWDLLFETLRESKRLQIFLPNTFHISPICDRMAAASEWEPLAKLHAQLPRIPVPATLRLNRTVLLALVHAQELPLAEEALAVAVRARSPLEAALISSLLEAQASFSHTHSPRLSHHIRRQRLTASFSPPASHRQLLTASFSPPCFTAMSQSHVSKPCLTAIFPAQFDEQLLAERFEEARITVAHAASSGISADSSLRELCERLNQTLGEADPNATALLAGGVDAAQGTMEEGEEEEFCGWCLTRHARDPSNPLGCPNPERREGDWECPSCGALNFAYMGRCNKCELVYEPSIPRVQSEVAVGATTASVGV